METRVSGALQVDPSRKSEVEAKRLSKSCDAFASILVSYMMKSMRAGTTGGDEQGLASGIYQDMFSEQVAKVIARSNTLGLGSMLCSELERSMKTSTSQPGGAHPEQKKGVSSQFSLNKFDDSAE